MNPLIQCKRPRTQFLIALLLACFFLLPKTHSVSPAPDGGYAGGNTAEGTNALLDLTTGKNNIAVGLNSLTSTTTGDYNTAIGSDALATNGVGGDNTAIGRSALGSNSTAFGNTAIGSFALIFNTTGNSNTATGEDALFSNTTGGANTATGDFALKFNTTGVANTATGDSALFDNTVGFENTGVGASALGSNSTGDDNTAVGSVALINNTTGNGNIALGRLAGSNVTTADNVICIGAPGANVSDSCYIGNVWQQPGGSQAVYVNASGKLGAQVSSRRFKDEIKPMEETSEVVYGLKPVSFRYKPEIEPTRPPGFGLIAEDVGKINPDLVIRDKEGKPYSVRYDAVNAMLLNEFLKENRKVQEQGATIARLEKEVEALSAGLQRVNDRLEMSKPAPQTVLNNQ